MNAGLCFVVIGAGQAGGWAARTLRDQSFAGRIVLIGDESHPPHERPPLSKSVLMGEKPAAITHLFPAETFSQLRIDCRVGRRALAIDRAAHTVTLDNGECLNFDRLLLATGGRARHLSIPGTNLPGIHVLRTIEHSLALAAELQPGRHILVIGGGWIGLEVAAAARKKGASVTVVETLDRLCARAVTPEMSNFLHNLHEQHGVVLKLGQSVTRFEGTTHVKGASLSDGSLVNCDAAVIGIGLILNVELASQASLAVDNGIVVDGLGRTSDPDIFAAGDVA
ncbi:MAG: pyridine nucleotide-disulfide oxidoreductase, partial [Alphaproteobacteria bacterium]|nr:pyridine nucleotide-disulfide oxidoreductase [Alphaproteobacteria bacterium]